MFDVDPDDIPSREVPYDPDMTVEEALRMGVIAMIDTGTIAGAYREPCGFTAARKELDPGMRCTRVRGHAGVHAYVLRWERSWQEQERIDRADALARAESERRMKDLAEQTARQQALMRQIENERMKAVSAPVKDLMEKALQSSIDRADSRVYGNPLNGTRKKDKFRDKRAGKVRG